MNEINGIIKALEKAENEVKSVANMKKISQTSAEMIRDRVRNQRKGVSRRGGNEHKLARLEPSTIRSRRRKQLHPSTSPATSNLTESGQLLDALYGRGIRKGVGEVALKSRRRGESITNDEVGFFVSGKRPWIDLSSKQLRKLEKITADKTQKAFEKYLNKLK